MSAAVEVIWAVGLVGALIGTLVVLKHAFLLLRTLKRLDRLSQMIATASAQVAQNVAGAEHLAAAREPAERVTKVADQVLGSVGELRTELEARR